MGKKAHRSVVCVCNGAVQNDDLCKQASLSVSNASFEKMKTHFPNNMLIIYKDGTIQSRCNKNKIYIYCDLPFKSDASLTKLSFFLSLWFYRRGMVGASGKRSVFI